MLTLIFIAKLFLLSLAVIVPVVIIASYFAWKDGYILIYKEKDYKIFPFSFFPVSHVQDNEKNISATLKTDVPIKAPFFIAFFIFASTLLAWLVIPFGENIVISDMDTGLIFIIGILLIKIYEIIFIISSIKREGKYEHFKEQTISIFGITITIGFCILPVILLSGAFNLYDIVENQEGLWFCILLFPVFITFFFATLFQARGFFFFMQRNPFYKDAPISSILFIISQYIYILLLSALLCTIFFGGWLPFVSVLPFTFIPSIVWFIFKTSLIFFCYKKFIFSSLIKKYENKWKHLFLLSILWIILTSLFLY